MFTTQLLNLLIISTPLILIFDGPITHGLVMAVAAISLFSVTSRIRPGEAAFLSTIIRPIAIMAIVPALYMLVQIFPLKNSGFANPVWLSAADALGRPLSGSISVDPGATLVALARYNSVIAIAFVAATVAINRHHAERVLFVLTGATTMIASLVIVERLGNFTFLEISSNNLARVGGIESAALGLIFAVTTALQLFERSKAKETNPVRFKTILMTCFIALVVTALAVLSSSSHTFFAVACGLAALAIVVIVRTFGVRLWGFIAIIAVVSVSLIAIITLTPKTQNLGLMLAFSDYAPTQPVLLTRRILNETGWVGTGAGTFSAIVPIYRGIDEQTNAIAPTATAQIAVEMGQPFLWAIIIAIATLVVLLFKGALQRGRDSSYCMAGVSCVLVVTLLAFTNAALFNTSVLILTGVAVGIAVAQSKSRSL